MENNMTPTPKIEIGMSFPDAMQKVIEGKRVARVAWGNADYAVLKDGMLKIFTIKQGETMPNFHNWLVNDGDMTNDDWIVLPDLTN